MDYAEFLTYGNDVATLLDQIAYVFTTIPCRPNCGSQHQCRDFGHHAAGEGAGGAVHRADIE
jgi:hypothetical protein